MNARPRSLSVGFIGDTSPEISRTTDRDKTPATLLVGHLSRRSYCSRCTNCNRAGRQRYVPDRWYPPPNASNNDDAFESTNDSHTADGEETPPSRPVPNGQSRGHSFSGMSTNELYHQHSALVNRHRRSTIAESLPRDALIGSPSQDDSCHDLPSHFYRLRSFSISSKGIINEGDLVRSRTNSSNSADSAYDGSFSSECPAPWLPPAHRPREDSINSHTSSISAALSDDANFGLVPLYRIPVLGHFGVGKTTLIRQLLTSEYVWSRKDCLDDLEELEENTVSVLLDHEESVLEFVESCELADNDVNEPTDAYVITYSVLDRQSFHHAIDLLYKIRKQHGRDTPIILVANKIDIIRSKEIAREEGQAVAKSYTCKYAEVSSMLHLKLDELLVGIVSQIRLHERKNNHQSQKTSALLAKDGGRLQKVARGLLHRLLRKDKLSSSCDNLLVL